MRRHETRKNVWVDALDYGNHYDGFVGGVKSITETDEHYLFTIFDKKGEISASIPRASVAEPLSGGIYSFVMNVKMEEGVKKAIVKAIEPAKEGTYSPMDIYQGISMEIRELLVNRIKSCIAQVRIAEKAKGEGHYSNLLLKYFTQNEVDLLAMRPGSVNGAARYMGGALHLIANVATLCGAARNVSDKDSSAIPNGLYDVSTDFPLMLTACLLCMAGMGEYVGDDMNKTQKGEIRGYHSLLQSRVEPLFSECGITQLEGDKLLNTLQCMFPGVGSLKSITLESSVCRACLSMYSEMDEIASYLSNAPTDAEVERGFRYSEALRRPFLVTGEGVSEYVS